MKYNRMVFSVKRRSHLSNGDNTNMTTYKLFYGEPNSGQPTHVGSISCKTDPYLGLLTNKNMVNGEPWWVILA